MSSDDSWKSDFSDESIAKAAQYGDILPRLPLPVIGEGKQTSEETIYVKILENPKRIVSDNLPRGEAYVTEVEHQGARKSMMTPTSLRFSMAKELKVHNLAEPKGHWFIIGASKEDLKATKNRPPCKGITLYWCQLKDKKDGEPKIEMALN